MQHWLYFELRKIISSSQKKQHGITIYRYQIENIEVVDLKLTVLWPDFGKWYIIEYSLHVS